MDSPPRTPPRQVIGTPEQPPRLGVNPVALERALGNLQQVLMEQVFAGIQLHFNPIEETPPRREGENLGFQVFHPKKLKF